jgi:hypothetical protein
MKSLSAHSAISFRPSNNAHGWIIRYGCASVFEQVAPCTIQALQRVQGQTMIQTGKAAMEVRARKAPYVRSRKHNRGENRILPYSFLTQRGLS